MSRGLRRAWQSVKDLGATAGLAVVVIAAGVFAAYQFVGPPPPDRIVMATGEPDGAYARLADRYAAILARNGITLDLLPSAGSVENLELLQAATADIGFVQSGLAGQLASEDVVALGSMYLEPLWLFLREGLSI